MRRETPGRRVAASPRRRVAGSRGAAQPRYASVPVRWRAPAVGGAGDTDPGGAQAAGHLFLGGGRPLVVVFAVEDEDGDAQLAGQLGGAVGRAQQILGHDLETDRIVAEHTLAQE